MSLNSFAVPFKLGIFVTHLSGFLGENRLFLFPYFLLKRITCCVMIKLVIERTGQSVYCLPSKLEDIIKASELT